MTADRMALLELVEKAADADLTREMLAFDAKGIMDAEGETLTGAVKQRTAVAAMPEDDLRPGD